MINRQWVRELTEAYLESYHLAWEQTRNPTLAVQAASNVLAVVTMNQGQNKPAEDPLRLFLAAVDCQKEKEAAHPPEDGEEDSQKEEQDL